MKKIISISLSLIMTISVLAPCHSVIAQEVQLQNIVSTGNKIAELCAEYDDYNNACDDAEIKDRLIVKASGNIDEYGAVDSVYGFGYAFLQYADEISAEEAKVQYENLGYTVDYDSVITQSYTYNYDEWPEEWAYEETDALATVDYYKLKAKSTINVAVVDSGINYNHELFKNRVNRTNVDFSAEATGDEMDRYGHGTNVAGAIAKSTPSNVKISSYKFYDAKGNGTSSMVLAAFEYIKQLSDKPDIINCSFHSSSGLYAAILELANMGITIVAAAGNETEQTTTEFAKCSNAIVVSAFDYYSKPCSFTNYGSQVAISAPGEHVYTADMSSNTAYTFANGTSLATPIVSAAAAIVLMEHNNYTPEQVKQELMSTSTPFKKSDCYYDRYGAGIVNFSNIISGTRCKDVTANYESGVYRDDISVELKCANTLVDIYYTTDGTLPTETNGTKYTEPIQISESTRIIASAYARAGTPFHSKFTTLDYYIFKNGESDFVIDNSGTIKAYLGNETNLVVPDKVNGATPVSIGENCFRNSNIESIVLPDTINNLLSRSFYGCDRLSNINLSNIKYIGKEALSGCSSLTQEVEFSSAEYIDERGLADTYFNSIKLPECTKVGASAFDGCAAKEIALNKATSIGSNAYYNCTNLETIYIPQATSFGGCSGCTNLKTVFAPMVKSIVTDIPSNTTIYCTGRMTGITFPQEYSAYKCTIVSPEYTAGLAVAIQDGDKDRYIHISSDEIAESKGAQIRTRDNGLRFGFALDENNIGFDFRKYADTINYGFVYTYESFEGLNDFQINNSLRVNNNTKNHKRTADKRNIKGDVSYYNAVFTNIPKDHLGDKVSARAYVNIDGMCFYSPVVTRSYSDVANAVLNDESVEQDIKEQVILSLN